MPPEENRSALSRKLDAVPDRPGVYLYRNADGKLLYVGKAKSLRSRVRSYFQPSAQHPPRTARLVEEVADLWFHTYVLLAARGLDPARVEDELTRRARRGA